MKTVLWRLRIYNVIVTCFADWFEMKRISSTTVNSLSECSTWCSLNLTWFWQHSFHTWVRLWSPWPSNPEHHLLLLVANPVQITTNYFPLSSHDVLSPDSYPDTQSVPLAPVVNAQSCLLQCLVDALMVLARASYLHEQGLHYFG